jgi:predicted transposase/invertase (TIGR01784 family)
MPQLEGIEKGIKKGKIEGIAEGIEKGKLELARSLLADGVSPDIIARNAKLPVEKIRELMN